MTTQEFIEWLDSDERCINDTTTLGITKLRVDNIVITDKIKTISLEIISTLNFFPANSYFYVEITETGYRCYSCQCNDLGDIIGFLIANRDLKFLYLLNCIYVDVKSYSAEKLMTYVWHTLIVDEKHWNDESAFIIFDDRGVLETIIMRCAANRLNLTSADQNIKYAGTILLIILRDGKNQYTHLAFEYDVNTEHVDIYQIRKSIHNDNDTQ